jgi:heterodisulfide reductase subunit C
VIKPSFRQEVANLLHATEGKPFYTCMQCALCSGTCPVVEHMDWTPREIIALVNSDMKEKVLQSNTFWFCASCYHCSVRCPREIPIADLMYALKRYSMWKGQYKEGMIGPDFSERFVKTIVKTGKSFEPALAPAFLFSYGFWGFLLDARTAAKLLRMGRLPLIPSKIKRRGNFRRVLGRIIPLEGLE